MSARTAMAAAVMAIIVVAPRTSPLQAQRGFRPVPDVRDGLAAFQVTLTLVPTAKGVALRREPAASLSAPCREGEPCKWTVDEHGALVDVSAGGGGRSSAVRLIVEPRKGGVRLLCRRGCMWPITWFPCDRAKPCTFIVNEFGVRTPTGKQPTAASLERNRRLFAKRLESEKKPDFSGHWVLATPVDADTSMPRELVVRQWIQNPDGSRRGVMTTRVLHVERRFSTSVASDRYDMEGPSGGIVGGVGPNGEGPSFKSSCSRRWDGDAFVIESSTDTRTPGNDWSSVEHRETWSLDTSHRLVITTSDRVSAAEPKTVTATYRKR